MTLEETSRMVARTVMSEIGPWGERCALFGGMVPGLLIQEPPSGLATHIGTRDVDLALRIAALGDEREMYRTLKHNLTKIGLRQSSDPSFEWRRAITPEGLTPTPNDPEAGNINVVVELFVPVDNPEQFGKIQRKPIEQSGSNLTALGIYGLEFIERDYEIVTDEGPLLDGLGIKKVDLRVCGPAMLLALKAWALKERNKTKDGYDIVWTLKALGPEALAARFRDAKIH
ncbi:MAG: hypothetical protein EOP06_07840, partial [Proteobacteria bacterium]